MEKQLSISSANHKNKNFGVKLRRYDFMLESFLIGLGPGHDPIKIFLCHKGFDPRMKNYAGFERSDCLKNSEQPIRALKTSVILHSRIEPIF